MYFHAVRVQVELVSNLLGSNSRENSVWVFQNLAPQRCPKNYSQDYYDKCVLMPDSKRVVYGQGDCRKDVTRLFHMIDFKSVYDPNKQMDSSKVPAAATRRGLCALKRTKMNE